VSCRSEHKTDAKLTFTQNLRWGLTETSSLTRNFREKRLTRNYRGGERETEGTHK